MQAFQTFKQIFPEHSRHRIRRHHGNKIKLHNSLSVKGKDKIGSIHILPRLKIRLIADPFMPGIRRILSALYESFRRNGISLFHTHGKVPRIGRHSGVKGYPVFLPLPEVNSPVGLIFEACALPVRGKAQIMRILPIKGAACHKFKDRAVTFRTPPIAGGRFGVIIALISVAVNKFKGSVFQHLGIQPAVGGVIDVLEKQPDHSLRNRISFPVCNL